MTKLVVAVTAVCVFAGIGAAAAAAPASSPPPGLTAYGRTVWNLDALLHDVFGQRSVYLSIPAKYPRTPRNFSTVQGANCCSAYYLPTFRAARGSAFRLHGPTKPPQPIIGASGRRCH